MNETKSCPYCGEEILATAKKCKHCGKWLEQKCPQCGEWVKAEAKKCRYCGYWLDPWQRRLQEKAEQKKAAANATNITDIQAAIEERKDEENAGCILQTECAIIVVLVGLLCDWPWWKYAIGLFVAYLLLNIHFLRVIYCLAASFVWGVIGVTLSPYLFDESEWEMTARILADDYSDYWWMGLIFAVVSLILHAPAMKSRFNF